MAQNFSDKLSFELSTLTFRNDLEKHYLNCMLDKLQDTLKNELLKAFYYDLHREIIRCLIFTNLKEILSRTIINNTL
jgi:hypothetical protein